MDIRILPSKCGTRNCIGLAMHLIGTVPPRVIEIEDEWDLPVEDIEGSIVGLISHETVEWLVCEEEERQGVALLDLHALIGKKRFRDYIGNVDGLP